MRIKEQINREKKRVMVYIDGTIYEQIKKLAIADDRSLSATIAHIFKKHLNEHKSLYNRNL